MRCCITDFCCSGTVSFVDQNAKFIDPKYVIVFRNGILSFLYIGINYDFISDISLFSTTDISA